MLMKLSKSASGILSARYRSVLIKCFLANLTFFPLSVEAATTISERTYENEYLSGEDSLLCDD